jgi:hypothetical protein
VVPHAITALSPIASIEVCFASLVRSCYVLYQSLNHLLACWLRARYVTDKNILSKNLGILSYRDQAQMGQLSFPLDAELTGPDRLVLSILKKQYEAHDEITSRRQEAGDESDDSGTKHSEFVAPSPEGRQQVVKNEYG